MHAQSGHIYVDRFRNVARLATDFDLANNLLQHALLFADAKRLTNQTQRNRDFNLLSFNQSPKICMQKPAANRIDLSIVEHHFTGANTIYIKRKYRVAARIRAENSR